MFGDSVLSNDFFEQSYYELGYEAEGAQLISADLHKNRIEDAIERFLLNSLCEKCPISSYENSEIEHFCEDY